MEKKPLREGKAKQTRKLILDIINGKYKEDEVDKVRERYIEIWTTKKDLTDFGEKNKKY